MDFPFDLLLPFCLPLVSNLLISIQVSFAQPSPHTTFVQQPVRRFEFAPDWVDSSADDMFEEPWVDDLTSDSIFCASICTLSAVSTCLDVLPCSCTTFDMTYSDCDGVWTVDKSDVNHVRAVEIIRDSGADGSALPMEYAHTGVATASDDRPRFVHPGERFEHFQHSSCNS